MAEQQGDPKTAKTVYEFTVNNIKGEPVSLEKYRGHVLIIVNVASKCGYTAGHYKELNELYDEFAESKGLFFFSHFPVCFLFIFCCTPCPSQFDTIDLIKNL